MAKNSRGTILFRPGKRNVAIILRKIILGLFVFFLASAAWLAPAEVFAQTNIGIKISPVRMEEIVDPGEVLRKEVKVTNQSSTAKTFYVYLRDFKAEGEGGTPHLIVPGTEEGNFMADWINISQEGLEFQPGEERIVPYTITVPANVGPGGYYGAVVFGTEPPKLFQDSEDRGAGIAVAQQAGCLVLLQVRGDVREEARVREFNTDREIYGAPFNVDFLVRLENLGNVHIKPVGTIEIINMLNQPAATLRFNEAGSNVLPNSIRRFSISWEGKMGWGRYTAKLGLAFGTKADAGGQGKQTLYAEKTFWVVPWKIVLPALATFIFFSALFWLFLRFYKTKAVRRALSQMGLKPYQFVNRNYGPSPAWHFALIVLALLVIAFLLALGGYFLFLA